MAELPEELITLILSKLPVKSLLRFKCVQKSWHSLINSPDFIRLHRSSSSSCLIVRRPHLERHVLSFYSHETLEDLGNEINIPFSFMGVASLSSSCDGLVCITNWFSQILICNPTIQEFRSLLFPPSLGYQINSVALGSDPNTGGQYKAVMIGEPYDNPRRNRQVWLYDFSADTWREATAVIPPGPFRYSHRAVSLNGAFHWSPWDHDSNNYILTFHMSNEVTGSIPLPDFSVDVYYNKKELCVSSKSQLSVILYNYEGRFEISVMTEFGVKESWTKLFNIGPLPPSNIYRPIVFWDEQRLLLIISQGQLVSWGLQHQNIRHFPIHGGFDVFPYSPSLVSVNGIGK